MYIYHALINALSAHMIHINLNMIFYTHVEHSPTKTTRAKLHKERQTHTPTRTHARTLARTHAHARSHKHTRTHARTHAHTHTHTLTHSLTYK